MNKYVIFIVLACSISLINTKSSKSHKYFFVKLLEELVAITNMKLNLDFLKDLMLMTDKVIEKCPDFQNQLLFTAAQVIVCVTEGGALKTDTYCSLIKENIVKCAKPVLHILPACFPHESQEFAIMGEKILITLAKQACNSTLEEIFELLNPCAFDEDSQNFPKCRDVSAALFHYRNELPNKELACSVLPKWKGCTKEVLKYHCHNPITHNAHMKFHHALDIASKFECSL